MQWKPVADAVKKESAAVAALKGRRVRLKQQIISPTHEPSKPGLRGPETTFAKGAEGFVGYASLDKDFLPVGFALEGEKLPDNFEQLSRKPHRVLPLTWSTFSKQLEIAI